MTTPLLNYENAFIDSQKSYKNYENKTFWIKSNYCKKVKQKWGNFKDDLNSVTKKTISKTCVFLFVSLNSYEDKIGKIHTYFTDNNCLELEIEKNSDYNKLTSEEKKAFKKLLAFYCDLRPSDTGISLQTIDNIPISHDTITDKLMEQVFSLPDRPENNPNACFLTEPMVKLLKTTDHAWPIEMLRLEVYSQILKHLGLQLTLTSNSVSKRNDFVIHKQYWDADSRFFSRMAKSMCLFGHHDIAESFLHNVVKISSIINSTDTGKAYISEWNELLKDIQTGKIYPAE